MSRQTVLLASFLLFSLAIANPVAMFAQNPPRRAFVEDLLRGLIDSHVQPQSPGGQPGQPFPNRNDQNPQWVPAEQPGQPGQRLIVETSREMQQARAALAELSASTDSLIAQLRAEEWQSPSVRPLLADTLKIKADIDHLYRKAQLYPRHEPLLDEFGMLDRDIRMLELRLKQYGRLSPQTLRSLQQIVDFDQKLETIFGVQPEVDRRELLRLTSLMRSSFQHLLQDLQYESRRRPELTNVLSDGRNVFAQLNQAIGLIQTADYPTIVAAYRNGQQDWRNFNQQLYRVSSERIVRDVQEIEAIGRQIQEQLWLPVPLDRDYVVFLTDAVTEGAARVFEKVTLNQLLAAPNPDQILHNARELQSAGNAFKSSVQSGQSIDALAWDHRLFDVQWTSLQNALRQLNDASIEQRLVEVDYTMATLKKTLGEGPAIDQHQLTDMAEHIDHLVYQLDRETRRRLSAGRYANDFQQAVVSRVHQVHDSAHQYHQWLLAGNDPYRSPQRVRQLVGQWDDLRSHLVNFQPADRAALANIQGQIEPMMVKLKLVFAN